MELRFMFSGSCICTAQADAAPVVGSEVIIRTESHKKGLNGGSLIRFPILAEFPPVYDYSDNGVVVFVDVNEYEELEAGPSVG
jgi:hypothetical protein